MRKQIKKIGLVFLLILVLYLSLIILPYVQHKEVPAQLRQTFRPEDYLAPDGEEGSGERIAYVNDNMDALLYRFKMIEAAEEEVIVSTFDFDDDPAGKDMLGALMTAAERGVKVRLIVDGVSGFMDLRNNPDFLALASYETASIKIYNPIRFTKPWKLQARLHDKYVIIDHKMFLLGGRNTMELFLGDTVTSGENIDRELFVLEPEGRPHPAIDEVRAYFERIWALPDSRAFVCKEKTEKIESARKALLDRYQASRARRDGAVRALNWEERLMDAKEIHLLSNPIEAENKAPVLWYKVQSLLRTGRDVLVYTPYIIAGKEMYRDMKETRAAVGSLSLITNDPLSGANPWGCTDYLNQKKKIYATGIKVYEFMGAPLSSHTKAALIDERLVLLGSFNWDMRSVYQDTELMLAVDSEELNACIRAEAARDMNRSKVMQADGSYVYGPDYHAPEIPFMKKLFYAALRVITIPIRRFL